MLTVGSLFSGVGGFDLGFERAGCEVKWLCEIDRDCRDVLCRHFDAPEGIFCDVRTIPTHLLAPVDIIIGGFPCQDVSVAGRRAGLAGDRTGLFYDLCRVIRAVRPKLAVLENVPGLLSSNGGDDFAAVLAELANSGAVDIAWRVLDAQWFGVAQRRRRVFIVCDFGGERAAEILALAEGLSGHPAPRREAGQRTTGSLADCSGERGWSSSVDCQMWVETAAALTSGSHPSSNGPGRHREDDVNLVAHTLSAEGADASEDGSGRGTPLVVTMDARNDNTSEEVTQTLQAKKSGGWSLNYMPTVAVRTAQTSSNGWGVNEEGTAYTLDGAQGQAVAFAQNQRGELRTSEIAPQLTTGGGKPGEGYSAVAFTERTRKDGRNFEMQEELAYALTNPGSGGRTHSRQIAVPMGVRRLMPTECEALQGWPRDWTRWGASGKEMSDSTRYRMIGNGVATPVAEWVARRIVAVAS